MNSIYTKPCTLTKAYTRKKNLLKGIQIDRWKKARDWLSLSGYTVVYAKLSIVAK